MAAMESGEATIEAWSREDDDDWGAVDPASARVIYPADVPSANVVAVRRAICMSQSEFALAVGISVWTLRKWEQHRRALRGMTWHRSG